MKFSFTAILFAMALSACSHTSSDSGASPSADPEAACGAGLGPTNSVAAADVSSAFANPQITWKLVSAEGFQTLHSTSDSSQFIYLRYHLDAAGDASTAKTICAGRGSNVGNDANFNFSVAQTIGGATGDVGSKVSSKFSGDPSGTLVIITSVESVDNGSLSKPDPNVSIRSINPTTLEVWTDITSNTDRSNSHFQLRSVYQSQPITQLELFQQAYQYASTYTGLALSNANARDFASQVSARGVDAGSIYLSGYKLAYQFGNTYNGMSLDNTRARAFASAIASAKNPRSTLATYKTSYQYATSYRGLGLAPSDAIDFANKQAGITF